MKAVLLEYVRFLRAHKKLWLLPVVAVLLVLGALAFVGQVAVALPFIYALF